MKKKRISVNNLIRLLPGISLACFLVFSCGCAVSTEYMNAEVLYSAASLCNMPQAVDGHALVEASLKPHALTFHYLREEPPSELWIIRFAESPAEQYPYKLRSFDQMLEELRKRKKNFKLGEKPLFKTAAAEQSLPSASEATGSALKAAFYSFEEQGKKRHGFFALWHKEAPKGGWVLVLNVVSAQPLKKEEVKGILKAFGAL